MGLSRQSGICGMESQEGKGNIFLVWTAEPWGKKRISGLITRMVRKIKYLIFRTTSSLWFEKMLEEPDEPVLPAINAEVEFLDEEGGILIKWLKENRNLFPWIYFEGEVEVARENRHIFAVIRHAGTIVGYIKIGVNRTYIHDFDKIVHFPAGTAFIYDTFILPLYRGKNLALFALGQTVDYLKERHFKKVWCHIEKWNQPSLRLYRKKGFKEIGRIRFSRIFGIPLFLENGCKPFTRFESFISRKRFV